MEVVASNGLKLLSNLFDVCKPRKMLPSMIFGTPSLTYQLMASEAAEAGLT